MKTNLIKYYSKINLGDDIFLLLLADRYIDHFLLLNSAQSLFIAQLKNVHRLKFGNFIYLLSKIIETVVRTRRNILISTLLLRSEIKAYIYIGGSLFIESSIKHWGKEADSYKRITKPYYILGSNIGPIDTDDFINYVCEMFKGAQDVCLRDRASYELVKDLPNTRLATDIAFTLDTSKYKIESKKRVVFSLVDCRSRFSEAIADRYEKAVAHMTERFLKKGYEVIYMSFCKFEGDEVANENAICRLPSKLRTKIATYNYSGDIEEALQILASSSIVVATRFHATILGLVFGKKVLPIAYSDKTLNILSDMHFPGPVIDIRDIEKSDIHRLNFESIPTMDVAVLKSLAETQFQELDKVLTRRADV